MDKKESKKKKTNIENVRGKQMRILRKKMVEEIKAKSKRETVKKRNILYTSSVLQYDKRKKEFVRERVGEGVGVRERERERERGTKVYVRKRDIE